MHLRHSLECLAVESTFAQANAMGELPVMTTATSPTASKRQRAALQAAVYGVGAAALYAAVFSHADAIMELTKKGGFMAAIPLALAFMVSYVHGHFTGAFWTALGIDASKKATGKIAEAPTVAPTAPRPAADQRPRAQLRV